MQRKLNDEFIREYSEEFSEKITTEFFADNDRITGKEILNVSPSKQVNFFILKILFRKWQEEMKKLESPFFNYKNPEVRKAMVQFMNTLSQHIEVSRQHFSSMVEEAVADTLLLAMDPGSYLSLEFEEMDVSKVTDKMTKPILKYIKLHKTDIEEFFASSEGLDIEEFVDLANEYFIDVETDSLVQQQVDLLSKVLPMSFDDLYFSEDDFRDEFDEEDEDEDLSPFEDTMRGDEEEDSEDVSFDYPEEDEAEGEVAHTPSEPAEEEESSELAQENSIVEEQPEEELEDTEESHLAEENNNDSFDEESFDEEDDAVESEDDLTDESQEEGSEESEMDDELEDDIEAISEEDSSEDSETERVESDLSEADEEEPDSSINQKYAEKPPTINDRFSGEKETIANKLETKQVNNIMEAISVNHRYMFTKELFDGDRDAFVDAIEQIDSRESFDDAVEMLVQNYANKRGWDMNSDEVKELLKVIFRRFR